MYKNFMALALAMAALSARAQWSTNGTSVYYSGGNVGIGTSTPNDMLEVSGGNIRLSQSGSSSTAVQLSTFSGYGYNYLLGAALTPGNGLFLSLAPSPSASGNPYSIQCGTIDGSSVLLIGVRSSHQHVLAASNDATNGSPWDIVLRAMPNNTNWDANNNYNALTVKAGAPTNSVFLSASGNVGIGTASPLSRLHVSGSGTASFFASAAPSGTSYPIMTSADASGHSALFGDGSISPSAMSTGGLQVSVVTASSYASLSSLSNVGTGAPMVLALNPSGGSVGIGTTAPGPYELAVQGTIGARNIVVTLASPWADYVFDSSYALRPLGEVEGFIKKNKRLPEVPSAGDVEKNGIDLGSTQVLLLKKIEELTLYLIGEDKISRAQDNKIEALEKKAKGLRKAAPRAIKKSI